METETSECICLCHFSEAQVRGQRSSPEGCLLCSLESPRPSVGDI